MKIITYKSEDAKSLLSTCCGAKVLGEYYNLVDQDEFLGICAACRDHASFTPEEEC